MKIATKKIALAALFVALDIIFARFLSFMIGDIQRISPQFLAQGLCGYFLGPWISALALVAADLLGMVINSAGKTIFLGFTVSAALKGFFYGLILHGRPVKLWRNVLASGIVVLGVGLLLNSVWLNMMLFTPIPQLIITKLPINLAIWVVDALVLYFFTKRLGTAVSV